MSNTKAEAQEQAGTRIESGGGGAAEAVSSARLSAAECRCPVRPYFNPGSLASGSATETALVRKWDAEHGHHPYAKARDYLAQALQGAEVMVRSGAAVLDMVADVFGLSRMSERCMVCGQFGPAKGGEYPCVACARPTLHDSPPESVQQGPPMGGRSEQGAEPPPVEQRVVYAIEAGDITLSDAGDYEAKTEAGRALLASMTPEELAVPAIRYVVREGHRRIRQAFVDAVNKDAQDVVAELGAAPPEPSRD